MTFPAIKLCKYNSKPTLSKQPAWNFNTGKKKFPHTSDIFSSLYIYVLLPSYIFSFLSYFIVFLGMASTVNLHEKHFLCSLCRNIFCNPVTTPCGHSFCVSCLSQFWSRHQSRYCPECRRLFPDRPNLSVNHILANVAETYKKNRPQKPPDEELVTFTQSFSKHTKPEHCVFSCLCFLYRLWMSHK